MVFPRTPHPRQDYYDLFFARIPGNLASLGYDELRSLTPFTRSGYRRIPWTALPPRWQIAFQHEIAAALTLSCSA
ncbi:hypothetical protein [Sulfobacillus thermosulfidooxidans]|jgi:hypothetical protein|uniref:hypothetical protein n=1 Tax=Sulfobacillus thermosulfidooxidans TaxID=28034 RepID=UPI00031B591D|nr:hypothetical protein [Sulfobacillus thermosulfidooxidans]